jgi:cobalt/nickel transport system permease protein
VRESVDPRLALAAALTALTIALASPTVAAPLTIAMAAAVPLVRGQDGSWRWRRLVSVFPALALGVATAALRAALTPGRAVAVLPIVGAEVRLSQEGVVAGGLIIARVMAGTAVAVALATRVPFPHLLAALKWARLPGPILEILRIAERQRHALSDAAMQIRAAASLRLGRASSRRRVVVAGTIAGAVLCRAVDQASAVAVAMALRGSFGLAGVTLPPRCRRADARFVALALPPLAVALALAVLGRSR